MTASLSAFGTSQGHGRVCLWERSLTALQTQPTEIRFSPTVTDNINMHSLRNR